MCIIEITSQLILIKNMHVTIFFCLFRKFSCGFNVTLSDYGDIKSPCCYTFKSIRCGAV